MVTHPSSDIVAGWSGAGALRFAIEDYLGAGAILSGVALVEAGYAHDVAHAAQVDLYDQAAVFRDPCYAPYTLHIKQAYANQPPR